MFFSDQANQNALEMYLENASPKLCHQSVSSSKTPKKVQTSICMIDVIKPDQISKFKNQYSTISKSNFNMVLTPSTVKDSFYPRKSGTKHADTSIWPMQGTIRLWTVMDYMKVIVKLWNHTWNAWRVTKTSGLIQEVH